MLYSKILIKDDWWSFYVVRMYEDRDGGDNLLIRVEREKDAAAFSELRLPDNTCLKSFGFSEDEIYEIQDFLLYNSPLMWDDYREYKEQTYDIIAVEGRDFYHIRPKKKDIINKYYSMKGIKGIKGIKGRHRKVVAKIATKKAEVKDNA